MTDSVAILLNGNVEQSLSVHDRGLHYGDGVFRTMRVSQGTPLNGQRQLEHLIGDAHSIGLDSIDKQALADEINTICHDVTNGVLKVVLTRGMSTRGYRYEASASSATRLLILYPAISYPATYWEKGVQVRLCEMRLAQNPRLAGIKHLNRLEQVLARAEWGDDSIAEGLMCDTEDRLIEGVGSNLFVIKGGHLITPDLTRCGVAGLTREMILEQAGIFAKSAQVRDVSLNELMNADECFVCNSVIGIWPIRRFEDTVWEVGEMTRTIQQHFGEQCPPVK